MHYCNQQCKERDFEEAHRIECCVTKLCKTPFVNPAAGRIQTWLPVLRLYSVLQGEYYGDDEVPSTLYDESKRSTKNLLSHTEQLKNDTQVIDDLEKMAKVLSPGADIKELVQELVRLAGVWNTNAIALPDETGKHMIGSGIFVKSSYFDHSCRPTAIFHFLGDNQEMEVRAIAHIPKSVRPKVNYLLKDNTTYPGVMERRKDLWEKWNFECDCELCSAEAETGQTRINFKVIGQKMYLLKELLDAHEDAPVQNDNERKTVFMRGREVLELLRSVFNAYDQRIVDLMCTIFARVVDSSKDTNMKSEIEKFAGECVNHINRSYGQHCNTMATLTAAILENEITPTPSHE